MFTVIESFCDVTHGSFPVGQELKSLPDGVDWLAAGFVTGSNIYPNSEANASAAVIKLADKHNLLLWSVRGTGRGGKIVMSDVKKLIQD